MSRSRRILLVTENKDTETFYTAKLITICEVWFARNMADVHSMLPEVDGVIVTPESESAPSMEVYKAIHEDPALAHLPLMMVDLISPMIHVDPELVAAGKVRRDAEVFGLMNTGLSGQITYLTPDAVPAGVLQKMGWSW